MSEYGLTVVWESDGGAFTDNRYSRAHRWLFDGGIEVAASSSPSVVPFPTSVEAAVDPEEAFIASLSSCHMLWFLGIAAVSGHAVERYEDKPVGHMGKDANGRVAMLSVTLRPAVRFRGEAPTEAEITQLHHAAHQKCFIANSVKTGVTVEPRAAD